MGTRSGHIEKYLRDEKPHKHLVFVLNKCDLVPTWVTAKWVQALSKEYPTLAFHASINNSFGKGSLIQLLRQFGKVIHTLHQQHPLPLPPLPFPLSRSLVPEKLTCTRKSLLIVLSPSLSLTPRRALNPNRGLKYPHLPFLTSFALPHHFCPYSPLLSFLITFSLPHHFSPSSPLFPFLTTFALPHHFCPLPAAPAASQ